MRERREIKKQSQTCASNSIQRIAQLRTKGRTKRPEIKELRLAIKLNVMNNVSLKISILSSQGLEIKEWKEGTPPEN